MDDPLDVFEYKLQVGFVTKVLHISTSVFNQFCKLKIIVPRNTSLKLDFSLLQ